MSYRFNEKKSIQLASIYLKLRGGEMSHMKLIKLMYLADREALKRWGHPVTGDHFVSMKCGPVLSNVLNLIHDEPLPEERDHHWSDYIQATNPLTVRLTKDPAVRALSAAEEELAAEIFDEYGSMNRWEIVDITHKFPEYREPDAEHKSWPLRYLDILKAVGKTESEANEICANIRAVNTAKRVLEVK
jgi:uncharacterized phage-associated protein